MSGRIGVRRSFRKMHLYVSRRAKRDESKSRIKDVKGQVKIVECQGKSYSAGEECRMQERVDQRLTINRSIFTTRWRIDISTIRTI